ncbi:tetratricopeptide repeat protein [Clostridium tepidiprofundi DSM 19306]|uniref:Tetratricopeptide repeat protein n=1 Tax=Clostridium tepidiprofundi DSM 19306 TaxID=1121338 RepID=A0A151B4A6_9CLOT|nr:tetratricopeptide repeat protein [Clostridium tepidiprofundi]KYH34633.1 tetratricopeptide repeat protein [Clostridium tepidiprofundi DSM 19306]
MKIINYIIVMLLFILLVGCGNSNSSNTKQTDITKTNVSHKETKNIKNKSIDVSDKAFTFSTNNTLTTFKQPVKLCEDNKNDNVFESINSMLIEDLNVDLSELDTFKVHKSLYEVYLGNVSKGMSKQLIAFTNSDIFLFECNYDFSNIKFLDKVSNTAINLSNFEIDVKDNRLFINSHDPFNAAITHYTLEWNGIKFKIVEKKVQDDTKDFYINKTKLLKSKDIEGLMNISEKEKNLVKPNAYTEFYSLPKPILILANNIALRESENKNFERAFKILDYGIEQYSKVWFECDIKDVTVEELNNYNATCDPNNIISLNSFISIYNNYAYFLYKINQYKEAESILMNVIELDPNRIVAYVNLGDVEWSLGNHEQAKKYYKKYLELREGSIQNVPKRVFERTK